MSNTNNRHRPKRTRTPAERRRRADKRDRRIDDQYARADRKRDSKRLMIVLDRVEVPPPIGGVVDSNTPAEPRYRTISRWGYK